MPRSILFLVFVLLALVPLRVQAAPAQRECVSAAGGAWSDPATWSGCDGATPGATDDVYIQTGHTVALGGDAAVHDLHISVGPDLLATGDNAHVALGSYTLDMHGKLRGYSGEIGVVPGANATSIHADAISMTPGTMGRLRIVGASRSLAAATEWGASDTGDATVTAALEVAADPDAIIDANARVQAANWTITSGTLRSSKTLLVNQGLADQGDFVVGAEGTLVATGSAMTMVGRSFGYGGALIVDGKLEVTGSAAIVYMRSVAFNNVVEYSAPGNQVLLRAPIDNGVLRYQHLVLAGASVKTLAGNTSVEGSLTRAGTATVTIPKGMTLTYGPDAEVIYAGTALQTTGPELPGTSAVAPYLRVANPGGVKLAKNVEVTDGLVLGGDLDTGTATLMLGAQAGCAGTGDVTGTVLRAAPPAAGTYCFGNPNVQITLLPEATPPISISVKLTRGEAPFTGAVLLRYQITAPGFLGAAVLRLPYNPADLNGNDPGKLQLWRLGGSGWVLQGASAHGVDPDGKPYVEKNGVTAFSDWTLATAGTPTAVTVAAFSAHLVNGQRWLYWQTASELDCLGFAIYRSISPATRGERIGEIAAQGTGGAAGADYRWQDTEGPDGAVGPPVLYYWLDVIDQAAGIVPQPQGAALRLPRVYLPNLQK